jgi:hypothetical protein
LGARNEGLVCSSRSSLTFAVVIYDCVTHFQKTGIGTAHVPLGDSSDDVNGEMDERWETVTIGPQRNSTGHAPFAR